MKHVCGWRWLADGREPGEVTDLAPVRRHIIRGLTFSSPKGTAGSRHKGLSCEIKIDSQTMCDNMKRKSYVRKSEREVGGECILQSEPM